MEKDVPPSTHGGPLPPVPFTLSSSCFQIPAPNSLDQEEDLDDLAREEMVDFEPDPFGAYKDDWNASTSLLDPGDLAQLGV